MCKVGDNCILCCITQLFPIADIVTRFLIRGKVRQQKGVEGTPVVDCLLACFCYPCTMCQEAQEVKAVGNMARE